MITFPKSPHAPAERIDWLDDDSGGLRAKIQMIRRAIREGWPMSAGQRDHILATLDRLDDGHRSARLTLRIAQLRDELGRYQVTG